ncbi:MAG TPA: type II secretion system protein E [Chloroflexota bacterium]
MEDDDARVALFREHPPAWWGWPWRLPRPMTVAELIAAGSMDATVAALLWVALERRASIIVAAGPNGAGKTVTLTALLDFLPPDVRCLHLQGMAEDFTFTAAAAPEHTYLLANEISDHLPIYLWGRGARRLFELLPDGYALGATLHAESVEETLDFLAAQPLSIPAALLAEVPLVLTLAVVRRRGEWLRRVAGVHLLHERDDRVRAGALIAWDGSADQHRSLLRERGAALAERLAMVPSVLSDLCAERSEWLATRLAGGDTDPTRFRAALAAYRTAPAP